MIEKIKADLKEEMVDKKLNRFQIESVILKTLKKSIDEILSIEPVDVMERIKKKEGPFVIIFVGINGSGKTTTIAKMAQYFIDNDKKPVLVAADTFRAAAIQQLEEHSEKLGIKMIKHDYGSDPAAVAFDGIKYAESKGLDVVLGNCTNIPFSTNSFDYVLNIAVLHHLSTIERRLMAVSEFVRIVKPKGQIMIQVWAYEQPKSSKRQFDKQDNMIKWHLQKKHKIEKDMDKENDQGLTVYERFYHVFKEGELEKLVEQIKNIKIVESFYDHGNWGTVLEKIK